MSDTEKMLVEKVKREAAVSLIGALAKAMGATVLYYNPDVGEFAIKMDPRAVEFFSTESLVTALGDVA